MNSVAYQGEPGAFSELAARAFFGRKAKLVPREHFRDCFRFASSGSSRFTVIPIENSIFGSVHENYDLLLDYSLKIVGEISLRIHHHLMALPGVKLADIRFVFSHPQALGQCDEYLRTMKHARSMVFGDTAGAARMIREEKRSNAAAVASIQAAATYKLKVLRRNIENDHHNYTRFLILSRTSQTPGRGGKTSLVFSTRNIPGALFKSLAVFALRDVNLQKIESRPLLGKPWEYLFYVDILGSVGEENVDQALHHLEEVSTFIRILGSYPPGRTIEG